jgi:hypothetical protein
MGTLITEQIAICVTEYLVAGQRTQVVAITITISVTVAISV